MSPIATQSSPYITVGWFNRPINIRSNSGLGSSPSREKIKHNFIILSRMHDYALALTIKKRKIRHYFLRKAITNPKCIKKIISFRILAVPSAVTI
jgi:hypothetical protein